MRPITELSHIYIKSTTKKIYKPKSTSRTNNCDNIWRVIWQYLERNVLDLSPVIKICRLWTRKQFHIVLKSQSVANHQDCRTVMFQRIFRTNFSYLTDANIEPDVTLVSDDQIEFQAHKTILAAGSKVEIFCIIILTSGHWFIWEIY